MIPMGQLVDIPGRDDESTRPLTVVDSPPLSESGYNMVVESDFIISDMEPRQFWNLPMWVKLMLWNLEETVMSIQEGRCVASLAEARMDNTKRKFIERNWSKLPNYHNRKLNSQTTLPPFWTFTTGRDN